MPANNRWDLIQRLKGYKEAVWVSEPVETCFSYYQESLFWGRN